MCQMDEVCDLLNKIKEKVSENINGKNIFAAALISVVFIISLYFAINEMSTYSKEKKEVTDNKVKTVRINEYAVRNKNTFRDEDWRSPDWAELYNYGEEPVWLGDIYISDDLEEPGKFLLPDTTLMPGEYLLVLASGNAAADDSYIRAPFKLGEDDKNILLYRGDKILDCVELEYLPTDISAGYGQDGSFGFFALPSPGAPNAEETYERYDISPENPYEGTLIINEYMSDNSYNLADDDGNHFDWIEIYNPQSTPFYLGDAYLSDDENQLNKFRLPDITLQGDEYIIIYASGEMTEEETLDASHAPFKLSPDDTKITLAYKSGYIINQCDVYSLPTDVSAGFDVDGNFGFYTLPTPGAPNDTPRMDSYDVLADYIPKGTIVINEWMPNNRFSILDAQGDASDWVEIYNPTGERVSLKGYALSDDAENLFKWTFPDDTEILPDGYILIFVSGKDEIIEGQLHTNFSLSDGETLYLIEPNAAIADIAEIEDLPGNVSIGRTEDGYGYFSLPTPGKENTTASTPKIEAGVDFLCGDVYISEVAASATHFQRYMNKSMYEYIEIYNRGEKTIDLSGYTIAESGGGSYVLEEMSINPNGYLLLSLKGYAQTGSEDLRESGMSLNSSGEEILLMNAQGQVVDYFDTGYLLGDYSSGRIIGDEETRVFFKEKTPGKENSGSIYTSYSEKPSFSHEGGMADGPILLLMSAPEDAVIYYTLDGNLPTQSGDIYTQPISIEKDTVVRAVALEEGKLPSQIENKTYILERKHELPIVCLTSPPAYLFYEASGIYANGEGYGRGNYPYFKSNYFIDLERPISFEYYDENGQAALAFDAGVQIAGGYSRAVNQKSLVVRLRDEYGLSEVEYPFFESGASTFRHIYLRNGGQDGWKTKIRDCFIQNSMAELGTVDTKRGRPVAVYINGEYWGMYNLRDKLNDEHLAIKYGIDQDKLNIISEYSTAKKGSNAEWMQLREFCQTHDFRIQENYDYLVSQIDLQSFIDYIIAETFYGNVDTHNITFWKADIEGSKWRPMMFDMDLSIRGVGYSMVNMYLGKTGLGFHAHIIKSLAKNESFKQVFIQRYSYVLNNVFTEEYFNREINLLEDEIRLEMEYHVDRWNRPSSMEYWQECMDVFKAGVLSRRFEAVKEIEEYFDLDEQEIAELFPWYTKQ